jgi:hypothetical protein
MLKSWKVKLGLLVLTIVFFSSLSVVFAQPGCNISTLQDDWQYPDDWCQPELPGEDTVDPGTDWNGIISPADPYATCSVSSNSGCSLECYVSADGSEVIVPVGPNHCGSFTVTITQPASGGCPESSASKDVRITGQGGGWSATHCCSDADYCGSCCGTTEEFEACTEGNVWHDPIEVDASMILAGRNSITDKWATICRSHVDRTCAGIGDVTCPYGGNEDCDDPTYGYYIWEWKCSCQ